MALTETFYDAVNNNSVRKIRIMMKDSLLVDPTFREFGEMERAARAVPGLYDAHDGCAFITDRTQWNDNYMNKLMVEVVGNFSHERLDHLKEVVHYLRPVSVTAANDTGKKVTGGASRQPQKKLSPYQQQKEEDMHNGNYRTQKIVTGTAVGAAVGLVAGGAATLAAASVVPVLVGTAAGAVIGGVATAVMTGGGD